MELDGSLAGAQALRDLAVAEAAFRATTAILPGTPARARKGSGSRDKPVRDARTITAYSIIEESDARYDLLSHGQRPVGTHREKPVDFHVAKSASLEYDKTSLELQLPLFGITYRRLTGPEYLIGGKPQTSVDITYFRDGIKIALVQQPAAQHRQRESAPGVPWIGEKVQVNGHDATLYAQPNEVDLDIRLGNTTVTIFGRDRQQVLKAAAALRKLN